jgi:hypothetical protein
MKNIYAVDEYTGKRLRDINYNEVSKPCLSIFKDDKEVAFGTIGDVLKQIQHLTDEVVKHSNYYFETLVLRL